MIEFERWAKTKKPYDPFCCHGMMEAAWIAALEWVLRLCPKNENATFANQGQGMNGYTELANYKVMYKKLKKELDATS